METKQKTLAECKDEVARKHGYYSYNEVANNAAGDAIIGPLEKIWTEAAELYASEENRKKDEPKPFGYVVGTDFYPYDSTLISELEKHRSTIVHASQSNGSYSRNQENDKLVSLEVEEEARIFCEQLDEEFGEAWSNDYDELPKRMAEFALKWQSQQLVSIQWLSGEEIENISIKTYFKHERMSSDTRAIIQAERGAFVNGFNQAQSSLRNRVNAVDPVEFAEWIRTEKFTPMTMNNGQYWDQHNQLHRLYGYRKTTQELLQIYINSKTKEHE